MDAENKKKEPVYLVNSILVVITVLLVTAGGFLKHAGGAELLRNAILAGTGAFLTCFLFLSEKDRLSEKNASPARTSRFAISYGICLAVSLCCAFLPPAGWPFLVVFVMMSLFCGFLPGICGGISFLTFSVLLAGADISIFALYVLTGLLGACLFSRLDEKYRIALPLFVSLSFLFAAETACVVLFANETLKWELFLIPALNVIISLILLLILLKVYSGMEIFKYRIKYLEINDQEFELLVNIKEKDKNVYYRAVHAAYFSERIAQALSLDADAAKTAAYYANAGILYKEPEKDLEKEFVSYGFPPYARQLLRELTVKNTGIRHKEAAVVYMADAVISSILYLFEKKQDTKTDYAAVIETVFQKKWESGSLKNSELTFAEWNRMKKIFKEEKLYYDFLR
mgnify:FL=1